MKKLLHIALFLVGLLATAAGIRELDAAPFWGSMWRKTTFYASHLDEYDTLFVGSSRVHYGFVPAQFDARMAELGRPTRSLNLGQSGLRQHDYDPVLDWVIEQRPTHLRHLLIELHAWDQGPRNDNWMTDKEIELHTWPHLWTRVSSIAISRHDFWTKCVHTGHATAHTLVNMFRIGQGTRITAAVLAQMTGDAPRSPKLADAGWEELSDATVPEPRRQQHAEWSADPGPALRALQNKRDDINVESLRGGFNVAGFRRQVARLRAAGFEPTYVVMPHYALNFYGREAIQQLRDEVTILEMDVPQAFEDVYEFANWYDWAHLMRPGAELFSRRIADECAKRLR